jgi:hypothetical protein
MLARERPLFLIVEYQEGPRMLLLRLLCYGLCYSLLPPVALSVPRPVISRTGNGHQVIGTAW